MRSLTRLAWLLFWLSLLVLHAGHGQTEEAGRDPLRAPVRPKDHPQADEEAPSPQTMLYRDVAYGHHPQQTMDIYVPHGAKGAPVLFMVHGGGWAMGSKSAPKVVDNKVAHWLPKGFIFISVDNRLLPQADPLAQAQDVAAALVAAQHKVAGLGGDPRRFVLMGHSAGAHLVSLLSADPSLALQLGALPWRGTVSLDSAALDVAEIMNTVHAPLYDRAFGSDPAFWQKVSPAFQLHAEAPPMLLVCSQLRRKSCSQSEVFARKASAIGVRTEVYPVAKTHGAINEDLGLANDYTARVDQFVDGVLR